MDTYCVHLWCPIWSPFRYQRFFSNTYRSRFPSSLFVKKQWLWCLVLDSRLPQGVKQPRQLSCQVLKNKTWQQHWQHQQPWYGCLSCLKSTVAALKSVWKSKSMNCFPNFELWNLSFHKGVHSLRIQMLNEGDFRPLCTVTFWQKVDFLISNAH